MSSGRRRPPVSLTATPWLRGLPCGVTYFKFLFTPTHRHSTTHRFMTDAPANDAARAPSGDDAPHRRPTTPRVHQAATRQHLRHRRALPWTAPPPTSRAVVSPQCPLANYNGGTPPPVTQATRAGARQPELHVQNLIISNTRHATSAAQSHRSHPPRPRRLC